MAREKFPSRTDHLQSLVEHTKSTTSPRRCAFGRKILAVALRQAAAAHTSLKSQTASPSPALSLLDQSHDAPHHRPMSPPSPVGLYLSIGWAFPLNFLRWPPGRRRRLVFTASHRNAGRDGQMLR